MIRRILAIGGAMAAATLALTAPAASANNDEGPRSCDGQVEIGTIGNDFLNGTDCDDFLAGRWGNDVVAGHFGSDFLAGNAGNDVLIDAADHNYYGTSDVLRGGRGIDRCVGNAGDSFFSCEIVVIR